MTNEQFFELLEANGWVKSYINGFQQYVLSNIKINNVDYNIYITVHCDSFHCNSLNKQNYYDSWGFNYNDVNKFINKLKSKCGIELKPFKKFNSIVYLSHAIPDSLKSIVYYLLESKRITDHANYTRQQCDKLITALQEINNSIKNILGGFDNEAK